MCVRACVRACVCVRVCVCVCVCVCVLYAGYNATAYIIMLLQVNMYSLPEDQAVNTCSLEVAYISCSIV